MRLQRAIVSCASCAAVVGAVLSANCGSKTPTRDPATTSTPTTTVAPTTTSTVPATTTTVPATTTIPAFDARISVENTPCIAPDSGPVSCTFAGSATGGRTPYRFSWVFTNPANKQIVNVDGADARPPLGCNIAAGVATFSVEAVLTVTDNSGAKETETRNQQIQRQKGCGV